jgi:hypothetical protein
VQSNPGMSEEVIHLDVLLPVLCEQCNPQGSVVTADKALETDANPKVFLDIFDVICFAEFTTNGIK